MCTLFQGLCQMLSEVKENRDKVSALKELTFQQDQK